MIPNSAKDFFWRVVKECLVRIHGLPRAQAQRKCTAFRHEIEARRPRLARDLFYHHEPFDVACDLAENPLSWAKHQHLYRQIREESQLPAGQGINDQ